jgi:hypothetical protein
VRDVVEDPCVYGVDGHRHAEFEARNRDRPIEHVHLRPRPGAPKVEQQRGRLGSARARDAVGQKGSRDRAGQAGDAEERADRIARQIDRFDLQRRHHGSNLSNHSNFQREDFVEVHEAVWQDVEDCAAGICDDVERQLAPFQRTPVLDDLDD